MSDFTTPLENLLKLALPQGGWGYGAGQPLHLEPTCLALLALSQDSDRHREVIDRALNALEAHADGTGLYRLDRGRYQAIWPSAMVLFTRHRLGHTNLSPKIAARLLTVRAKTIKGDPEVNAMFDINPERVGWPWAEGTFSWAEPTSWAVLSLRLAGHGDHARVIEGVKLLIDRSFETGGINYGNRRVLGKLTEPIPGPTALMLLALQGQDDPRVHAAREYLRQTIESMSDLDHLGWGILALHAQGETIESLSPLQVRLRDSYERQSAENRPIGIVRHALTALASLIETKNPFRLEGEHRNPVPTTGEIVPPAKPEDPPKPGFVEGMKSRFRNVMVRGLGALRQPPNFGGVHIARAENYEVDLLPILQQQYEHFRPHLPFQGKRIVLKPNLVEYRKAQAINTDPRFIDAVIQLCKAEGASEIIVAEGPGHWRNVEFLVEESGLGPVLRKHGVRFVDLNHDEPIKVPNMGRLTGLDFLYLTRTILSADVFISLPKMKTHHWAGATLSLKNLFGTLPGICYGWPKNELHWHGIPNSIIDIALTQTPHMAIVDGIVGMEGDGPLAGPAKDSKAIVMGLDLVAVDATCCRLMMLPPERLPTLMLGAQMKLGRINEAEIPQIGESIESLAQRYEWPPQIEENLLPKGS